MVDVMTGEMVGSDCGPIREDCRRALDDGMLVQALNKSEKMHGRVHIGELCL